MVVQAQTSQPNPWLLCEPDELAEAIRPLTNAPPDAPIQGQADRAQSSPAESSLEGNVQLDQGDQRLRGEKLVLDRLTNRARAEGRSVYGNPDIAVRSEGADVDLNRNVGVFDRAEYFFPERNAQGSAAKVTADREAKKSDLEQATYSTCKRGAELWQLRTGKLNLDQNTGRGIARDLTLAIGGVPVLYFPYLSFPINDQRQSGFLSPTFGFGNDAGLDVRIPYYWNIAPNQDMTFSPRVITQRGVQLGVEHRFLRPRDRGVTRLEYLPDDRVFGADRYAGFLTYQANPTPNVFADVLLQGVSDDDYLDDLENTLDLLSPTSLERRIDLNYFGGNWRALARVQNYQTLSRDVFVRPTDKPYSRLPQLLFDGAWGRNYGGLRYKFRGELVNFDRDRTVTGSRVDVQPSVSLPLATQAAFITPSLGYRYTAYNLRDAAPEVDDNPTRGAPIVSLDTGLFFERPMSWLGGAAVQTLEPRLYYLYVPFRRQRDIPLFDSTNIDQGYPLLFLENRFTGADRLGDANQLTTALTTRIVGAKDGRERLRASIGQIHYFRSAKVMLDSATLPEEKRLDTVAEALVHLGPYWSVGGSLQWDTDWENTRRALDLRYFVNTGQLFKASYRFADSRLEQVDLALIWPLSEQWSTMARWNYSLLQNRSLDVFAGFEYDSCCWALRMLARQQRDSPDDDEVQNSVLMEVELKGLAGVGTNIDKFLRDTVVGFETNR